METSRPEVDGEAAPRRRRVGIGEHAIATEPAVLATSGLGSCVGLCLYAEDGQAGLAHCMLPSAAEAEDSDSKPGKYVDTGIKALCEALLEAGAPQGGLRAKVAGGSDMLGLSDGPTVGERNVAAARAELGERNIRLVAAETGGGQGRSVAFETETGTLRVNAADGSTTVL